jgi:hypothetical protein
MPSFAATHLKKAPQQSGQLYFCGRTAVRKKQPNNIMTDSLWFSKKFPLQSLQTLYTFVLRAEIATIFGPNVVIDF